MFAYIFRGAFQLDNWLKDHVGRPYTIILSVGLVLAIVESIEKLAKEVSTTGAALNGALAGPALAAIFQVALLINLAAQLHEHRTRYHRKGEEKK